MGHGWRDTGPGSLGGTRGQVPCPTLTFRKFRLLFPASTSKSFIFVSIILIQRADFGSNLPVVPYERRVFQPLQEGGAPYIAFM